MRSGHLICAARRNIQISNEYDSQLEITKWSLYVIIAVTMLPGSVCVCANIPCGSLVKARQGCAYAVSAFFDRTRLSDIEIPNAPSTLGVCMVPFP